MLLPDLVLRSAHSKIYDPVFAYVLFKKTSPALGKVGLACVGGIEWLPPMPLPALIVGRG